MRIKKLNDVWHWFQTSSVLYCYYPPCVRLFLTPDYSCPYLLMLIFQDILLRDQGSASGGFTKSQKEIVQQHISHRLRFSLRVGFSLYILDFLLSFLILYMVGNMCCSLPRLIPPSFTSESSIISKLY